MKFLVVCHAKRARACTGTRKTPWERWRGMERPSKSTWGAMGEATASLGSTNWRNDYFPGTLWLKRAVNVFGVCLLQGSAPALERSALPTRPKPCASTSPAPCSWDRSKAFGVSRYLFSVLLSGNLNVEIIQSLLQVPAGAGDSGTATSPQPLTGGTLRFCSIINSTESFQKSRQLWDR